MNTQPFDIRPHARFAVRHVTRFEYSAPVSHGFSEVRVTPVDTALQQVVNSRLVVEPACRVGMHHDYFGNVVHHFSMLAPHDFIEVTSESEVQVSDYVSGACAPNDPRPTEQRHAEYLHWSRGVPKLVEYAQVPNPVDMRMPESEFQQALYELAAYFFRNFRYDPDVTHVHSTPKALFEHGGGVCQDMAHAMIGVLRLAGIPARYVSGYIYDPKQDEEGQHLRGAAASHAWLQAWHPEFGWRGIDPTNDRLVDWQYVRTSVGRDYYDVTPVKGVFRGNVEQQLSVAVQVTRLE